MIKRVVDVVGAVIGLLLASPVLLVAAVLIKVDSPGPVLFCQERIGSRFIPFLIYKLRTMAVGRDEVGSAITRDKDSAHHAHRRMVASDQDRRAAPAGQRS